MRTLVAALIASVWLSAYAADRVDVLFLGLTGDGAPSFEKTCEGLLRADLASSAQILLVDAGSTRAFRERLDPRNTDGVTRDLVESLRRHFGDSVFVVWVGVESYRVAPRRSHLVICEAAGEASVRLTMIDLRNNGRAMAGAFTVTAERYAGLIPFSRLDQAHVPVSTQLAVTDELAELASARSASMVRAIVRSRLARDNEYAGGGADATRREPSIRDIFDVPVTEPKDVVSSSDTAETLVAPGPGDTAAGGGAPATGAGAR